MDKLISRQAVINMKGLLEDWTGKEYEAVLVEDIERLPSAKPVDYGYLVDWFINSVGNEEPVWTEEHINELTNDFYVMPKIEKGEEIG